MQILYTDDRTIPVKWILFPEVLVRRSWIVSSDAAEKLPNLQNLWPIEVFCIHHHNIEKEELFSPGGVIYIMDCYGIVFIRFW